jgi:UDP-N-acetylmuramyl pentapeptide phosphotransferase/UDP-N-acetylglucosamine-1-phosphate transferase
MKKRNLLAAAATVLVALPLFSWVGTASWIAFGLSLLLLMFAQPLFVLYAQSRPNARSSHTVPVPQGGGGPIILATLVTMIVMFNATLSPFMIATLGAALCLGFVGLADDIKGLAVMPRLLLQTLAVELVLFIAPPDWRIFGQVMPLAVERVLLILAGVWFVNLTNFMDGIDGITLAGLMPLAVGAFLMDEGAISPQGKILASSFLAAQAAFIFFNWHPARLFLGDVGSLPMGLISGVLLFDIAAHGAIVAAVILPLYHFLDATSTLLLRLKRGERVWEAHRKHAYQRAVDGGLSQPSVSGMVLLLNVVLVGLALFSVGQSIMAQAICVCIALTLTSGMIVILRYRVSLASAEKA